MIFEGIILKIMLGMILKMIFEGIMLKIMSEDIILKMIFEGIILKMMFGKYEGGSIHFSFKF